MSLVAGSTIRPQQQQLHHATTQQSPNNAPQNNNNSNLNSCNSKTNPPQVTVNCMQQPSPSTPTSIKTSLSTSPIATNYMGSASLFSFESGVVLSGSSGCCSLSNSPSSSSSSNSYLTPQPLENSCNKLSTTSGNQISLNTTTNLEDSFASGTCQLNASLLAAVNGDLEEDNVMPKSLTDSANQTETHPYTSKSLHNHNNDDNEQRLLVESLHNQNAQQSTAESSCLNSEDARTLQLAVELTMMNLNQMPSPKSEAPTLSPTTTTNPFQQLQSHHLHHSTLENHNPYSSVGNPYHLTTKVFLQTQSQTAATLINQKFLSEPNIDNIPLSNQNPNLSSVTSTTTDERSKKSQNMTECVPVPSSEHVAEIVGRQGCKIKALRAKTNTYIKTPVRNEEPVFVVTGRKEDVAKAKREILSAAEHFTLIRATRRTNDVLNGCSSNLSVGGNATCNGLVPLSKNSLSSATPLPGQITIQVRVPYRVVGLVVGPKGNTIKHIQHETQTYIVTPSRDKEPIFEVTGMPDNVQMAKKQIEAHIATRTGNALAIPAPPPPPPPPPAPGGAINRLSDALPINQSSSFQSLNSLNQILNDDLHSEILSSIYKNGIGSALEYNQLGGCILNTANKCNNTNSFNGYMKNELNASISSVNDLQRQVTINSGSSCNDSMQINCNDLINNIIDPNNTAASTQFAHGQNSNFPNISNNSNGIRNFKTVVNSFNLVESTTNGSAELSNQQNNLNTNSLLTRSCSSASSTASSSKSFNNSSSCNTTPFWKSLNGGSASLGATTSGCSATGNNDSIDIDEGIGESPLYSWGLPNTLAALTNSYCSPTSTSISPTDSLFGEHANNKTLLQQQIKISPKSKLLEKLKRKICWMCHEKDILATLIPCGHTIFCSLCANRLCQQNDACCPVCSTQIYQAIRVH